MNRIVQRGLIFCLAIALIAGGLPSAWLVPCAAASQHGASMQHQAAHHHAAMTALHHETDVGETHSDDEGHADRTAAPTCNCDCLNLCNAVAAIPIQPAMLEGMVVVVKYARKVPMLPDTVLWVDPGIPILAA